MCGSTILCLSILTSHRPDASFIPSPSHIVETWAIGQREATNGGNEFQGLGRPVIFCHFYPLVNIQKAIEHGHRNSEFSH